MGAKQTERGQANEANEMDGAKQNERGKMMRAVGMAGKIWQANSPQNKHCRQTQPADAPSGTGLKTNGHQMTGLAAKPQQLYTNVGLLLSVQCR